MTICMDKTIKISEYINATYVPHNCAPFVLGVYTLEGSYIEYTGEKLCGSGEYTCAVIGANTIVGHEESYISDTVIFFGGGISEGIMDIV